MKPALPQQSPTRVRWLVLGGVAFASASAYLTRHCIAAANTTIQAELGFDELQMGSLMSGFALGYLFFQLPGGWLGSRFGTRLAFPLLSVLWSLSNAWSAMASAFQSMWASRFSLGVFQAGLTPNSAMIVRDWMPLPSRGVSSAAITASMSVGGAFTIWLTGWALTQGYHWRAIFGAYSLVGIAWAVGFYWFFRSSPRDHPGVNQAELDAIADGDDRTATAADSIHKAVKKPATPGGQVALNLLASPAMWGLCVQAFFRSAGYAFFVTWFFAFLEYAYGIGKAQAGLLNSLPLLAVVVGSLWGGAIIDGLLRATGSKWISRNGTAIVSLTACGVFTTASAWTDSATQLSLMIAAGAFFSGIAAPTAWVATIDIGRRDTAAVMGTMNMAATLAAVILPVVLGSWFKQVRESGGDWDQIIHLHAAFYFLAAAAWLAVNPNRQVSEGDRSHAV